MKHFYLLFIIVFFCCINASSQSIDELKQRLAVSKNDTAKANALNDIADFFYFTEENDSSRSYAVQALNISEKLLSTEAVKKNLFYYNNCKKIKATALGYIGIALYGNDINAGLDTMQTAIKLWKETNDKAGLGNAYAFSAQLYSAKSDYAKAVLYYDTALNYYKAIDDKHNISYSYYNIALMQRYTGNHGDALENNIAALNIAKSIKDTSLITLELLSNGFIYMYVNKFSEALKNEKEAMDIFVAKNDSFGVANVYNDMGVISNKAGKLDEALNNYIYSLKIREQINDVTGIANSCGYISRILQKQGKYKEAIDYATKSIRFTKKGLSLSFLFDSYNDLGSIYFAMNDYTNALKNYDTALSVSRQNNNRQNQAEVFQNIARVSEAKGNTNEAIYYLKQAEAVVDTYDVLNLKYIYRNLSTLYAKNDDYKNAYESSIKYKKYSDSVASNEKAEKLTSLTSQLEFENKQALLKASQDKQLAVQQSEINRQKLVRNIIIAGLIIVIALAVIYIIRFREKKKLNNTLQQTLASLKSTQSQLIHAEKMASLGELTAGIAHEIQNPLNFVNNFSEISNELIDEMNEELNNNSIDEAKNLSQTIKENLGKINYHGKRADAIVKGMLQHSRTNSGQKEFADINALCDEYLRLSYHGLRAKDKQFNAEIKTGYDTTINKIKIIPQDIGRALLNLYNNAFYAVNEKKKTAGENYKPTVSVTTKASENKISISVKDNGSGIPQAIKEKIFQPFFTTKPTGQGTGLGLSLTYDIIKTHNGEIKVTSNQEEGTEFIIVLPA